MYISYKRVYEYTYKEKNIKKIILNCLPPVLTTQPILGLSVLSSYMKENGFDCEVVYWNIVLKEVMGESYWKNVLNSQLREGIDTRVTRRNSLYLQLLPYLFDYAKEIKSRKTLKRLSALFNAQFTIEDDVTPSDVISIFEEIDGWIEKYIKSIDINDVLAFGFSAKFYQWIPALYFARKLKEVKKDIPIIIGGLADFYQASEVMKIASCFDFAVWGEGEIPLLKLANFIVNGDGELLNTIVKNQDTNEHTAFKSTKGKHKIPKMIQPDHSDFLKFKSFGDDCYITVEKSRGCSWSKCKFCALNLGYSYKEKKPEILIEEMSELSKAYESTNFCFMDNNIVGKELQDFDHFLDLLIEKQLKENVRYNIAAEVAPKQLNSKYYEKMSIAGIKSIQVGFEALSDSLLNKMSKEHGLADNFLALKCSMKHRYALGGVNIIRGIPGETDDDVLESIENLAFMRFYLGAGTGQMKLSILNLEVYRGSRYYAKLIKTNGDTSWTSSEVGFLFPLKEGECNYDLFSYAQPALKHNELWKNFEDAVELYERKKFSYKIKKLDDVFYYEEYSDSQCIKSIVFQEKIYWDILQAANDSVVTLDSIYSSLNDSYTFTIDEIAEYIEQLKRQKLLYANSSYNSIVSIIDTDI